MEEIVDGLYGVVKYDCLSLPHVAFATRKLGARTPDEIRKMTLDLVSRLYDKGLRPGDLNSRFLDFWPDEGRQTMLDRIEREWIAFGNEPNLGHPICYFDLKRG
jgi:hypothetical protein